jgi:hypothetical protein
MLEPEQRSSAHRLQRPERLPPALNPYRVLAGKQHGTKKVSILTAFAIQEAGVRISDCGVWPSGCELLCGNPASRNMPLSSAKV